jgi:hypothetical protein
MRSDQLLRTLPVRRVQALPEEALAAFALAVNRAGTAAVGSIVFGFLCGTAGTLQAEDALHLPERA